MSASQTPPWPGLGAYAVSKAALDKLVDAWRAEHPDLGFTRLVVGECAGGEGDAMTGFADGWDQDLATELLPIWISRAYMSGAMMPVERVVAAGGPHPALRRHGLGAVGDRRPPAPAAVANASWTPRPPATSIGPTTGSTSSAVATDARSTPATG